MLTHSTSVGTRNPGSCVVNAFGEAYPYALCPARPEVREYAAALVAETAAAVDLDGVMLEACGAMGLGHLGHHEKTAGADWSAEQEALLSICFCTVCVALLAEAGEDPDVLRAEARARVDEDGGLGGLDAVLRVTDTHLGTVDEVADGLAADRTLDEATDVSFQVHSIPATHALTLRSLELLGAEVAPRLGLATGATAADALRAAHLPAPTPTLAGGAA
ncbi:hypothetical protein [Clavibacter michiganensis]|uniref:hypothetical protein n=1 Tax=Clavibacter michiganensis TaxID=28447 RepID=UPI00374E0C05